MDTNLSLMSQEMPAQYCKNQKLPPSLPVPLIFCCSCKTEHEKEITSFKQNPAYDPLSWLFMQIPRLYKDQSDPLSPKKISLCYLEQLWSTFACSGKHDDSGVLISYSLQIQPVLHCNSTGLCSGRVLPDLCDAEVCRSLRSCWCLNAGRHDFRLLILQQTWTDLNFWLKTWIWRPKSKKMKRKWSVAIGVTSCWTTGVLIENKQETAS